MLFAFLVLPHGSYFCPARNPLIEAGNGQSSRCLLLCSPAARQPPRLVEAGAGGRSPYAGRSFGLFPAGLPRIRRRFAKKKKKQSGLIPPHVEAGLFNWGLSSKAPKPPLDRFRGRCKPLIEAAYLTRENVRTAFLEIIGFQAINC